MTQLALFTMPKGTTVQRTVKRPDGSTWMHRGRLTLATDHWLFYQCDKAGCMCRVSKWDRAHSSHRAANPRPRFDGQSPF